MKTAWGAEFVRSNHMAVVPVGQSLTFMNSVKFLYRSRLFAPLFATKAGGSGPGPAVAQQILKCHGRSIIAYGRISLGLMSAVSLPVPPTIGTC